MTAEAPSPWSGLLAPSTRRQVALGPPVVIPAPALVEAYDRAHMACCYATDEVLQAFWAGYRSALRSMATFNPINHAI